MDHIYLILFNVIIVNMILLFLNVIMQYCLISQFVGNLTSIRYRIY